MKVYPFKIPKPVNENLIVQVDLEDVFYDKLHQHQEVQISYIVEGTGKLLVSDRVHGYEPGDLFLIGSEMPHLFQSDTNAETRSHMISLFFKSDSFGEGFFDLAEMEEVSSFIDHSETGYKWNEVREEVAVLMTGFPESARMERFIGFLRLLKVLNQEEPVKLSSFQVRKSMTNNEGSRLQMVFEYVLQNFKEEIALTDVANRAHMTPNAFCRFFKQRTNTTFFRYLIALRIEHACGLLRNSGDMSMTAIAFDSGFRSISNFNRKFMELKGITPSAYAKMAE